MQDAATGLSFVLPQNKSGVIASEAKQSSLLAQPGLLRRFAPRNEVNTD